MKQLITSLVLSLVCVWTSTAQEVTTDNRSMVTGLQPAVILNIKGADPKFVDAKWKEYTKSYGKAEKVKGSKEYVIQGVHIGDIGGGELMNVYHYASQAADGTELTVWFSRGGNYLRADDKEYPSAEKFLKAFAHKVNVDMIAMDLEEQQKKLEKLESNLAKLVKEKENLHKTIETNQAKISQAETDIPLNERAQEAGKTDIDNQKAVVESVKENPEEYKMQQKLLAKLVSNLEKLVKENQGLHKTITDSNAKIKQAELDIETNLEEQKTTQGQIDDQKKVVELVQTKLTNAKNQKPVEPEKK
jgi:predicted  nucleic acid-binding Zn-ribbon protein